MSTVESSAADGIGRLTLNNPPLNILTREVLRDLRLELSLPNIDQALRVVVLGSAGKHFSAGADVAEHLPPAWEDMINEFMSTITTLRACRVPLIAAVHGRCLGAGFEIVQACDLVVAGESAQFGQPEILLGVVPPAACALLPDLMGRSRAAEIVFTGDPLTAAEAKAAGLVARVVPDERVDEEARALAARIARHSSAAVRAAKRALRNTYREDAEGLALAAAERVYNYELMKTADATEGLTAFLEKRAPAWRHA